MDIFFSAFSSWDLVNKTVIIYIVALIFLIFLLPVTWTQFLWSRYKEYHDDSEHSTHHEPHNRILNFFYWSSVKVLCCLKYFDKTSATMRAQFQIKIILTNSTNRSYFDVFIQIVWNEILRIALYLVITMITAMTTVFNLLVNKLYTLLK